MRIIDFLIETDVSAGTAGAAVAATVGLFAVLFTGIWLAIPLVYG